MAKAAKKVKKVTKPAVKKKRPRANGHNGYGIVSPYGDMWTSTIFNTADQAKAYVKDSWKDIKGNHDVSKYRIVWARQTARYIREAAGDNRIQ